MKTQSKKQEVIPSQKDRSLKTPQSIIHIKHRISLLQYKYWVLLLHEYHGQYERGELPDENGFRYLPMSKIIDYLGYEPKKNQIWTDLLALKNETLAYNFLEKDGKPVKYGSGFISEWTVSNGGIGFRLPSFLEDVMRGMDEPRLIFQLLNWDIFNHFSGKYDAVVYKLCRDYIGVKKTPYMTIPQYREYIGLDDAEYQPFDDLNKRCISGPCKSINTSPISDITVNPDIDRKGRKAIGIRFLVEPKDKALLPFLEPEPNPAFLHSKVPIPPKNQEKYLSLRTAEEISLCIERANDYGERQEKEGKAPSYGALYRTAIEEGWHVEQACKKATEKAEQAKKKAEADAKRKVAAEEKARKEKIQDEQKTILEWFAALAEVEQAEMVAAFLETAPHTRRSYQKRGFESPVFLFPFIAFLKDKRLNAAADIPYSASPMRPSHLQF
jgi:hypothetical protein